VRVFCDDNAKRWLSAIRATTERAKICERNRFAFIFRLRSQTRSAQDDGKKGGWMRGEDLITHLGLEYYD